MNTTVMDNLDQPIQPTQSQGPTEQNPTQQHHSSSIELMEQSTSTLCNTSSIEVGSYVSTLVQETMSRSTSFMELPDYGSTSSMELTDHAFTSIDNNGMNIRDPCSNKCLKNVKNVKSKKVSKVITAYKKTVKA